MPTTRKAGRGRSLSRRTMDRRLVMILLRPSLSPFVLVAAGTHTDHRGNRHSFAHRTLEALKTLYESRLFISVDFVPISEEITHSAGYGRSP